MNAAFASCALAIESDRRERRAAIRQPLGVCVCGVQLARHFDDRNVLISCDDLARTTAYAAAVAAHDAAVSDLSVGLEAYDAAATVRTAAMHTLIEQAKAQLDALVVALNGKKAAHVDGSVAK